MSRSRRPLCALQNSVRVPPGIASTRERQSIFDHGAVNDTCRTWIFAG
jgi:hypothetical protein